MEKAPEADASTEEGSNMNGRPEIIGMRFLDMEGEKVKMSEHETMIEVASEIFDMLDRRQMTPINGIAALTNSLGVTLGSLIKDKEYASQLFTIVSDRLRQVMETTLGERLPEDSP